MGIFSSSPPRQKSQKRIRPAFLPKPQYERIYWVFVLRNLANFFQKTVECRDEVWYSIPAPCRLARVTTQGGLLQTSSVHEHEQIADGRSLWEHDSRILGIQFMHAHPRK